MGSEAHSMARSLMAGRQHYKITHRLRGMDPCGYCAAHNRLMCVVKEKRRAIGIGAALETLDILDIERTLTHMDRTMLPMNLAVNLRERCRWAFVLLTVGLVWNLALRFAIVCSCEKIR